MSEVKNSRRVYDQPGNNSSGSSTITPTNITYAALLTLFNSGTMTPGYYNITDRADKGIVIQAISATELALNGSGVFLNPDFQDVGTYTGVIGHTGVAFIDNLGVWYSGFGATTINYGTLVGGTFAVGNTITDATTGAIGKVLSDNGSNQMTVWRLTPTHTFLGTNGISNGAGVTAVVSSAIVPTTDGLVTIWNGLHYQVTNSTLWTTASPDTNPAYTVLPKTVSNVGYIEQADYIEYDLPNDRILWRWDRRGNVISLQSINNFQWGNDLVYSVIIPVANGAYINCINQRGQIQKVTILNECTVVCDQTNTGVIFDTTFDGMGTGPTFTCNFDTNVSGQLWGCVVSYPSDITFNSNTTYTTFDTNSGNYNTNSFPVTIDITGLTTLDITTLNNFVGIINLTSSNATESINLFANFPVNQSIRFYPQTGLTLTFVNGAGANQPRCFGATNKLLHGSNQNFIEFTNTAGVIYQTNAFQS